MANKINTKQISEDVRMNFIQAGKALIVTAVLLGAVSIMVYTGVFRKEKTDSISAPTTSGTTAPRVPPIRIPMTPQASASVKNRVLTIFAVGTDGKGLRTVYSFDPEALVGQMKFDEGSAYYADSKHIYRILLPAGNRQTLYTEKDETKKIGTLIGIHGGIVYFGTTDTSENYPYSYAVKTVNQLTSVIQSVKTVKTNTYSAIQDVWHANGMDVVEMASGDSCGGGISISVTRDGKETSAGSFGEGCAEGPRFIGLPTDGSRVLAGAMLPEPTKYQGDVPTPCHFDALYFLHLDTGSVEPLYDMKPLGACMNSWSYGKDSNIVVFTDKTTIYVTDLTDKTTKKYPLSGQHTQYDRLFGRLFVRPDVSGGDLDIFRTDTGERTVVDVRNNYRVYNNLIPLGVSGSTVYFSESVEK